MQMTRRSLTIQKNKKLELLNDAESVFWSLRLILKDERGRSRPRQDFCERVAYAIRRQEHVVAKIESEMQKLRQVRL